MLSKALMIMSLNDLYATVFVQPHLVSIFDDPRRNEPGSGSG
jgi:hypothetical protein